MRLHPAFSCDIYHVRNACLGQVGHRRDQKPFQGQYSYDRIIWLDSDNIINPDQVEQLISRDVDVVAAWCRQYASGSIDNSNRANCGVWDIEDRVPGVSTGKHIVRPYTVGEMLDFKEKGDLIEVDYVGMGLMIIKKGVLESLDFPWFDSWSLEWEEGGHVCRRMMSEDSGLCYRLKQKGYKIMVDPTVNIQHEKRVLL